MPVFCLICGCPCDAHRALRVNRERFNTERDFELFMCSEHAHAVITAVIELRRQRHQYERVDELVATVIERAQTMVPQ
jgi:hypothetical protein